MKSIYKTLCLLALTALPSCIEEYGLEMEDEYRDILVVEGQIIGGTECEFIIQRTSSDPDEYKEQGPKLVDGAIVHVICSNGQVFGANRVDGARHYINLGELDPNETYNLQIQIGSDGFYDSEPMYPVRTPEITELSYTLSNDGEEVQLRISNEDPHAETYYMWTYDEHWEVNTPLIAYLEYTGFRDDIIPLKQRIDRGWCHESRHPVLYGSNVDYGNGALKNHKIYTLKNSDNRFNTRYHTKIRQIAISREEYEYYKQMEAQSTKTGGIFTLMPTQLPTNIHSRKGLRAVGYISVHFNATEAELYINRQDVGHTPTAVPEIVKVEKKSEMSTIYQRGFRLYHYDQVLMTSEWTRPWCIDCRDPYWGASLDRPDFWQDN